MPPEISESEKQKSITPPPPKTEKENKRTEHADADLKSRLCGNAECNDSWGTIEQSFCFGIQLKRVG